ACADSTTSVRGIRASTRDAPTAGASIVRHPTLYRGTQRHTTALAPSSRPAACEYRAQARHRQSSASAARDSESDESHHAASSSAQARVFAPVSSWPLLHE